MKTIKLRNSGFELRRAILVYDEYTWTYDNLIAFGGIISFRIIKINKT